MKNNDNIHKNAVINSKMEFALSSGGHVWLVTDWHMIRYDKETQKIYDRDNAADIIATTTPMISPKDVVIFMGDIVDSEVYNEYESCLALSRKMYTICSVFKKASYRVLLYGNNDTASDQVYKALGFDAIVPCIVWRENILISHMPVKTKAKYNIHGHLHIGDKEFLLTGQHWTQYKIRKTKQYINVFNNDRYPVDLMYVYKHYIENGEDVPNDVEPKETNLKPKKKSQELMKQIVTYSKELLK